MRSDFITEHFLLQNASAVRLYEDFACHLPIIDYHSHLPPADIAADRQFENLTRLWLSGDHYKWRAMRAAGVAEWYCTGDASDWEKFEKWAETVPQLLRNPLYHWTHLELSRPLGITDRLLSPNTAKSIWEECNAKLARPEFSARGIMRQMNVRLICTTDDPTDTLEHHRAIAQDPAMEIRVLPTFRPDKALAIETPAAFNAWVERLAEVSGINIGDNFDRYLEALEQRYDFFHAHGCRLADHGLESLPDTDFSPAEAAAVWRKVRTGRPLEPVESVLFRATLLHELAVMNHRKGWVQQLHLGAVRNNNTRLFESVGPDAGCDSIGDAPLARPLARFLDRLDRKHCLTKTIVYNLNPAQNEVVATMLGNFQDGSTPGKMQYGSAWWFLDQKDGIEKQLETLSNQGVLSTFVGMVTDSRSFLSFSRHDYFRRILCNLLGREMEQGLLPDDMQMIGRVVRAICYENALRYFGLTLPSTPDSAT